MALHGGIDTVAFVSNGLYSETYGLGEEQNIANLFASQGMIEDLPSPGDVIGKRFEWMNFLGFIRR